MTMLKDIYPKYAVPKPRHGRAKISRGSDKGTSHSYIEVYDRLFAGLPGKGAVLLEVGVASGKSLLMWEEFLVNGRVHGIDRIPMPAVLSGHAAISYAQMDAYDEAVLSAFASDKEFDAVVEDGSHVFEDQAVAVRLLLPRVKPCGILVVEDVTPFENAARLAGMFPGGEVIDMRANRRDSDDVMVVFRKDGQCRGR